VYQPLLLKRELLASFIYSVTLNDFIFFKKFKLDENELYIKVVELEEIYSF
jgi:hypothetical protein